MTVQATTSHFMFTQIDVLARSIGQTQENNMDSEVRGKPQVNNEHQPLIKRRVEHVKNVNQQTRQWILRESTCVFVFISLIRSDSTVFSLAHCFDAFAILSNSVNRFIIDFPQPWNWCLDLACVVKIRSRKSILALHILWVWLPGFRCCPDGGLHVDFSLQTSWSVGSASTLHRLW